MLVIKSSEKSEEKNPNKLQHFVDEWGSIDNISYNENTGKPIPQPTEKKKKKIESKQPLLT